MYRLYMLEWLAIILAGPGLYGLCAWLNHRDVKRYYSGPKASEPRAPNRFM